MARIIIGVVLILVAAGGYFYLDQMNKQELQAAQDARKAMADARAEAAARAAAMAKDVQSTAAATTAPAKP